MRIALYLLLLCSGGLLAQQRTFVHTDQPFWQDFSIKYYLEPEQTAVLQKVAADRNGNIQVLASSGMLQPQRGQFLYPGTLVPEQRYRAADRRKPQALSTTQQQFVYLDSSTLYSRAWAGSQMLWHKLPQARVLAQGAPEEALLAAGSTLHYLQAGETRWQGQLPAADEVLDIRFQQGQYWILGKQGLYQFAAASQTLQRRVSGDTYQAFELSPDGRQVFLGTAEGYWVYDLNRQQYVGAKQQKLPWPDILVLRWIGDKLWFGSAKGAFALRADGQFDYYQGERWLPSDRVIDIASGPEGSVLLLCERGLARIQFQRMTLQDKARLFEAQVRERHIRYGFNASLAGLQHGDLSTGYLADSDNDGLWTSMYLAGQVFRYRVTQSPEALQNCRESLAALERLYTIHSVAGFPARSFERTGFQAALADPERWQIAPDSNWLWKATTSSDEAIGHVFAFGVMAELIGVAELKQKAIRLLDTLMSHILRNDLYLVDYDGKPTTWGRWNPAYVNAFPTSVGDRKLNASNIIAMLQTAYHFTQKKKYRDKAFELMQQHGYLDNLRRPMREIGVAPADADPLSKDLSDAWNHSDDEMYFLGYWGLYRYAFNDTLRQHYRRAILDHWELERPEKEGLWNLMSAITGARNTDLPAAIWYLQEHPLDLIDWGIQNSHRRDLDWLPSNFRKQTTRTVLPPDERPIQRHNANAFTLDRTHGNGTSEHSAGDIWLLPYWLGRFLGVISGGDK